MTLAVIDFKLRFFGSVLGYLWSLMRPLLLFSVLYVVFTKFVRLRRGRAATTPRCLLTSIVLFTFFSEATSRSVTSLADRENLRAQDRVPAARRAALGRSCIALFNLGLNLLAVLVFVLATGVEPRWSWLEFPLLLIPLVLFATGVAMLLSALYVALPRRGSRSGRWCSRRLFYATPILYTMEKLPDPDLQQRRVLLQPARHDASRRCATRSSTTRADRRGARRRDGVTC